MDRKTVIKNLRKVLLAKQEDGRKYSAAWLEDVDFGGLYYTEDFFVLNVIAEHEFRSIPEKSHLVHLLHKKAKAEAIRLWNIKVHKPKGG